MSMGHTPHGMGIQFMGMTVDMEERIKEYIAVRRGALLRLGGRLVGIFVARCAVDGPREESLLVGLDNGARTSPRSSCKTRRWVCRSSPSEWIAIGLSLAFRTGSPRCPAVCSTHRPSRLQEAWSCARPRCGRAEAIPASCVGETGSGPRHVRHASVVAPHPAPGRIGRWRAALEGAGRSVPGRAAPSAPCLWLTPALPSEGLLSSAACAINARQATCSS